jgi:hypothetical protein
MNGPAPSPVVSASRQGGRRSGPQGTRLFSVEELHQFAREMEPDQGRASAAKPVLQGCGDVHHGKRFVLRGGRQTIGRRHDNDIVLDDLSVSASHAWIINQQGQYVIMNTLSTNGTFVNGKRVHEARLRHGDRVRFGQAEFQFLTREATDRYGWRAPLVALAALALAGIAGLAWWLL